MRLAFVCAVLAACHSSVVVGDLEEITTLRAVQNHNLDILFVVDNSPSMTEQQQSLAANFTRMIDVLEQLDGGLPDLHIGVVTSDMGTSSFSGLPAPSIGQIGLGGCTGNGDNGALHHASAALTGSFISDIGLSDGTRQKNYTGALRDVFGQIALVGAGGCGFEQHLSAMRRSFTNPANVGFIRPNANLAVVIIADEDDCSVLHPALFSADEDMFGPLTSYRCTRFGVECSPDDMTTPGTKANCEPRKTSQLIEDVQPFVDALVAQKPDPRYVMVAAIVGDPNPVKVELNTMNGQVGPALIPSCRFAGPGGEELADPAVRLAAFLDAFPGRSTLTSICNADLSGALTQIGSTAKKLVGDPCLDSPTLADASEDPGLQPACEVLDVRDSAPNEATIVPMCAPGVTDCFEITPDLAACPSAPDNLRVKFQRTTVPALDTWTHVRCQLAK
jgi:hypothetical protein